MASEDERRQLEAVRMTLRREFADRVDAAEVDRHLAEIVDGFTGAPIRTFVPVLVHRQARRQLTSTRSPVRPLA